MIGMINTSKAGHKRRRSFCMIEPEMGGRGRVIDDGDANWDYTALRLNLKATKTKARIRRSTDEDRGKEAETGYLKQIPSMTSWRAGIYTTRRTY
jgi:hypothetical protein